MTTSTIYSKQSTANVSMEEHQQKVRINPSHISSSLPCCTGVQHHEQISAKEQPPDEWKRDSQHFKKETGLFLFATLTAKPTIDRNHRPTSAHCGARTTRSRTNVSERHNNPLAPSGNDFLILDFHLFLKHCLLYSVCLYSNPYSNADELQR